MLPITLHDVLTNEGGRKEFRLHALNRHPSLNSDLHCLRVYEHAVVTLRIVVHLRAKQERDWAQWLAHRDCDWWHWTVRRTFSEWQAVLDPLDWLAGSSVRSVLNSGEAANWAHPRIRFSHGFLVPTRLSAKEFPNSGHVISRGTFYKPSVRWRYKQQGSAGVRLQARARKTTAQPNSCGVARKILRLWLGEIWPRSGN
jgi:hypothetical protein